MICSNKLLSNVELILFLNKCDILDQKLKSGVRLSKYVRSYQDRSNDADTVQKCAYNQSQSQAPLSVVFNCGSKEAHLCEIIDFRSKFNAIQREHSPTPRKFYGFCTSVTEITTTAGILASGE